VRLGGKERLEDLVCLLRGLAPRRISLNGHQNFLFFRSLRLDGQLGAPIHFLHRIDAVIMRLCMTVLQLAANRDLKVCASSVRADILCGLASAQEADQIFKAFFITKPHARESDGQSAARSLNRMTAACGLPRTLRAAQVLFHSTHQKPRPMKTPAGAPTVFVTWMRSAMRAASEGC